MIAAKQIFLGRSSRLRPYDAEVEYLESTGTQWIDTMHIPTITTRLRLEAAVASTGLYGNNGLGSYQSTNRFQILVSTSGGRPRFSATCGSFPSATADFADTSRHLFILDNGGGEKPANFAIDAIYSHDYGIAGSLSGGFSIAFFARHNANGFSAGPWRIYAASIFEGHSLVRDFIPVRRAGDGYLYDRVSGQPFRNAGAGEFIIGIDK